MFNVRSLHLLLLCNFLFAFQPPDMHNNSKNKRELSDRKDLPHKAEKMTPSINNNNTIINDRDTKKANGTLARRKRFAHLARLKRRKILEEDEFDDDDEEEENLIEEPYLHCKESRCKNGGSCFQRGKEFWCVCGANFAGKWCEMKRELSVEGAGCDKSMQFRLAIALGVVVVVFFLFLVLLIYWCRRRVPRWKNEKEEWDQLLKDRLDDDSRRKISGPPLPCRRMLYSPKRPQPISSNENSPKYISLTDIRKYLDNPDGKDLKKSPKERNTSMDDSGEKPSDVERSRKESRPKSQRDPSPNEATMSGGFFLKNLQEQTEMKLRNIENLSQETNAERFAANLKKIQRASLERLSPRTRRLPLDVMGSSSKNPFENFLLFSESPEDPKELVLDEDKNS